MNFLFNGQLIDSEHPSLDGLDLNPEQSVFETFKITKTQAPAWLNQHWERLFTSAQWLGLKPSFTLNQAMLDQGLNVLVSQLEAHKNYRCKVLMSDAFWWIQTPALPTLDPLIYTEGVVVDDALEQRSVPQAKWSWPGYSRYFAQHHKKDVFETLLFDETDHLLEGSYTSVIAVIDDVLVTPQHNVLPGITVRQVLQQAQSIGFKTEFRSISRTQLKGATEILLTNAIKGLVPVKQWRDWETQTGVVNQQLQAACTL